MVSPSKQIWKDFSSGKGGNVVKFLMEHEHMTFPEALRGWQNVTIQEIEETLQTEEERQKNLSEKSIFGFGICKKMVQEQLF